MEPRLRSRRLTVTDGERCLQPSLKDVKPGARKGDARGLVYTPGPLEQRQLKVSVSKPSREALRWKKNQAHRLINRKPKVPSKGVSHGSFVSYEVVPEGEVKLVM